MLKNLFLSGNYMKNTIIGLILGLIIAMWAFYIYTQKSPSKVIPKTEITPTTEISLLPTSRPDKELITEALAIKYNQSYAEVKTIIPQITSTHASGTVSFSGEGGWFLAIKDGEIWKIVADGNGTVSCETVAPYNFPVSMVSECVDKNGKLQKL